MSPGVVLREPPASGARRVRVVPSVRGPFRPSSNSSPRSRRWVERRRARRSTRASAWPPCWSRPPSSGHRVPRRWGHRRLADRRGRRSRSIGRAIRRGRVTRAKTIAVGVSGEGSNLRRCGRRSMRSFDAETTLVFADRDCSAVRWARERRIETLILEPAAATDRVAWDLDLARMLLGPRSTWSSWPASCASSAGRC